MYPYPKFDDKRPVPIERSQFLKSLLSLIALMFLVRRILLKLSMKRGDFNKELPVIAISEFTPSMTGKVCLKSPQRTMTFPPKSKSESVSFLSSLLIRSRMSLLIAETSSIIMRLL